MALEVLVTPTFTKIAKKLHAKDKGVVDKAVKDVAADPTIGEEKKGDLSGVFVYKFKLNKQELLLSYRLQPDKFRPEQVVLLSLGSHENFYSNLKRLN
jgi:mRNA-degrading endonuclease RelE of RelBE toxin-antitoxin system